MSENRKSKICLAVGIWSANTGDSRHFADDHYFASFHPGVMPSQTRTFKLPRRKAGAPFWSEKETINQGVLLLPVGHQLLSTW